MNFNISENDVKSYVKERFIRKFDAEIFDQVWNKYKSIPAFKVNENWFEKYPELNKYKYIDELHYVLRLTAQFFFNYTLEACKIDIYNDPNVYENLKNGNIGTSGRIVKWMTGANVHDDRELMGGRFHKPVRLAKFPNNEVRKMPIIKEVDLTANCSHHFLPFSTKYNDQAKVVIAYIPKDFVLGISKLQRLVRYVSQRGWLQEDLTKAIYEKIVEAAETHSAYVKLKNIEHGCEIFRGSVTDSNGFTTEYFGGDFETNPELLQAVRSY